MSAERLHSLDLIVKVVEVCNLACTYCYYYFSGDDSWKSRPKTITPETVDRLLTWLDAAVDQVGLKHVSLTFHGGEPLLLSPQRFDAICRQVADTLGKKGVSLHLLVQTNGMLVNDRWIDLFSKHAVAVGVSIDGSQATHDSVRVDKRGQGSYKRVIAGLEQLIAAYNAGRIPRPGILAVLNPAVDYPRFYSEMRHLGVLWMDFLMPQIDYQSPPDSSYVAGISKALCDLADSWLDEDDPDLVQVRIIKGYLSFFKLPSASASRNVQGAAFVTGVNSIGELKVRDEIMATGWSRKFPQTTIERSSLFDFVRSPVFCGIAEAIDNIPRPCRSCDFVSICRGGKLENRYSKDAGFDQKSVFCDGLKTFFKHLIERLQRDGYPEEILSARLAAANAHTLGQTIDVDKAIA